MHYSDGERGRKVKRTNFALPRTVASGVTMAVRNVPDGCVALLLPPVLAIVTPL